MNSVHKDLNQSVQIRVKTYTVEPCFCRDGLSSWPPVTVVTFIVEISISIAVTARKHRKKATTLFVIRAFSAWTIFYSWCLPFSVVNI